MRAFTLKRSLQAVQIADAIIDDRNADRNETPKLFGKQLRSLLGIVAHLSTIYRFKR